MSVEVKWRQVELSNNNFRLQPETPDNGLYSSEEKREWKRNFVLVTLPFLFFGFPLNVMVWETDADVNNRATCTSSWWFSFFKPCRLTIILTILFFIFSLATYLIIVQSIYQILYDLLYLAVLTFDILGNTLNLVRYLPLGVPLVLAWLWGFQMKNLIRSFDLVRAEFHERLTYSWRIPPAFQSPISQVWIKLLIMYVIIGLIQVVIILITNYGDSTQFTTGVYWIGLFIQLNYNLVFPVYGMCCWALQSEFNLLSLYLESLVLDNFRPTFRIFSEIKDLYKKISLQVVVVNSAFGMYMSFVVVVTLSTANVYLGQAAVLFGPYAMGTFFSNIGDGAEAAEIKRNWEIDGPPILRVVVGYVFLALLHLLLVLFSVKQAIRVNSAARYIHVNINDFVTHASATVMTPELYQSYRLLKFYIHSTMEQIEKPVLLRISILNFLPYFGRRLHTYNLRF